MKSIRSVRLCFCAGLVFSVAFGSGTSSYSYGIHGKGLRQYANQSWTIPVDTVINMRLDRSLTSKTARVGDRFTATVTIPVYVRGRAVIPAGAIVEGRVTEVTPAKRMSKSGTIAIDFDHLVFPDGSRVRLVGNLTSDDPETRRRIDEESRVSGSSGNRPAVFVGGGGAIGAVLGGMAGGGKGAVLGGVVGAGAGVAGVLLSKGEEAQVPAGTPFGIQLRQPLVIQEDSMVDGRPQVGRDPQPVDAGHSDPETEPQPVTRYPDPRVRPPAAEDSPMADSEPLPLSSTEMVRRAQTALRDQGYYEGQIDGVMGARVTEALRAYQREHNLPQTGDLDPETAKSLGITGPATASDRRVDRPPVSPGTRDRASEDPVLASVISATASRTSDGGIYVFINTQASTGGWRWFGEHVVNGDTLEVYARAVKPTGVVTQVLTKGRIELTVRDGVQYVRQVVVHGARGDVNIPLGASGARSSIPVTTTRSNPSNVLGVQRRAEEILSEYQRAIGVRLTGTGIELDSGAQYREPEIELLFALDNFANASQLYARLVGSLRDADAMRGATLALAREARRTDRVITTSSSRSVESIAARWDAIRQDVLRLMQSYNINSSELEN